MGAYDVHQSEDVVFDGWFAVICDHSLVHDDQRLDESLAAHWPRCPSSPPLGSPSSRRRRCRHRPAPIWPPAVDDRRRPPFVLIVGGRGPDGSRTGAARVRRVPATVVVCIRQTCLTRELRRLYKRGNNIGALGHSIGAKGSRSGGRPFPPGHRGYSGLSPLANFLHAKSYQGVGSEEGAELPLQKYFGLFFLKWRIYSRVFLLTHSLKNSTPTSMCQAEWLPNKITGKAHAPCPLNLHRWLFVLFLQSVLIDPPSSTLTHWHRQSAALTLGPGRLTYELHCTISTGKSTPDHTSEVRGSNCNTETLTTGH